jgi:hypothetical protein
MFQRLILPAAVFASLWLPGPASASEIFAEQIGREMPCPPQCSLCHVDNTGGPGKLNAFGTSMKSTGGLFMTTVDPVLALQALATANTDTDGDGVSDAQEVREGRDPSVSGERTLCGGPQYGCGARVAKPAPSGLAGGLGLLTALVLGGLVRRRRSRG